MSSVSLSQISKHYLAGQPVLDGINLHIEDGEFVVFVGPSGSGKSTLLRMIAGLEEVTEGEIFIGDQRATDLPAAQRGLAMVFQSYALYPHMSVRDNMGFALRMAGEPPEAIARRVDRAARLLQIEPLLDRRPKALSGGQRQRVAIGRAIVREPRVFLFDEPLSNLDAALRQTMRVEIAKLHRDLGATMIYVTHDQVEAMTLADRIAVFDRGAVQQVGTPAELYRRPCNLFVAGFLGSPRMNFLDARLVHAEPGRAELDLPGLGRVTVAADLAGHAAGEPLTLGVRPEHLRIDVAAGLPATVELVEYLGDHQLAHVGLGDGGPRLCLKLPPHELTVAPGAAVRLGFAAEDGRVFDSRGRAVGAGA
ncbi:MAG: ABC transporter ATP-binding protein [Vitreoscilla sp.]|nr:ABC transporter ATP-binding protein [Vitreoscilla sp.]